ncbi:hypothetical protein BJ508DRAFT_305630 [Ascobolus immersus RN42]|uniref:Uncharacterized protein n=1 Tax=Ascobolus immersus RN42 TaxID=1160509 RepID=A0A3N4I8S8_ASCIM|nr:hypothetical protein BJ508DRAFT_305630 [Ascobolus immersus RN42]
MDRGAYRPGRGGTENHTTKRKNKSLQTPSTTTGSTWVCWNDCDPSDRCNECASKIAIGKRQTPSAEASVGWDAQRVPKVDCEGCRIPGWAVCTCANDDGKDQTWPANTITNNYETESPAPVVPSGREKMPPADDCSGPSKIPYWDFMPESSDPESSEAETVPVRGGKKKVKNPPVRFASPIEKNEEVSSVSSGGVRTPSVSTASGSGWEAVSPVVSSEGVFSWDSPSLNLQDTPNKRSHMAPSGAKKKRTSSANARSSMARAKHFAIPFPLLSSAFPNSSEPIASVWEVMERSRTPAEPSYQQPNHISFDYDFETKNLRIFGDIPTTSAKFLEMYLSILATIRSLSADKEKLQILPPELRNIFETLMKDSKREDRVLVYTYLSILARGLKLWQLQEIANESVQAELTAAGKLKPSSGICMSWDDPCVESTDDIGVDGIVELVNCIVANSAETNENDFSADNEVSIEGFRRTLGVDNRTELKMAENANIAKLSRKYGGDKLSVMFKKFIAEKLVFYRFEPKIQDLLEDLPHFALELLLLHPLPAQKPDGPRLASKLEPSGQTPNHNDAEDPSGETVRTEKEPRSSQRKSIAELEERLAELDEQLKAIRVSDKEKAKPDGKTSGKVDTKTSQPLNDSMTTSLSKKSSKKSKKSSESKVKSIWSPPPTKCTSPTGSCGYIHSQLCDFCFARSGRGDW